MSDLLWAGRMSEKLDDEFAVFQGSLKFDRRLVTQDIRGSIAHAEMLALEGILTGEEGQLIVDALSTIDQDIATNSSSIPEHCEDIHSAVETLLRGKVGDLAGKLHTARSRNDQVATDFRLFIKEACQEHILAISCLKKQLLAEAERHLSSHNGKPAVLPGYTHLQVAQPLHLSHWLLAYFEMLTRDESRFAAAMDRMDECPLGAAALCGTSWPINRTQTADRLGFSRPMRNSVDAVSSRDFVIDYLSACSNLMVNLSRLAEDLIIYSTSEFGFVSMPDSLSTGSSIMPQKKNPDLCELTRAKSGRLFGHLMGTLVVLKALPSSYNKDLQEDKEATFDAYDTLGPLLALWTKLVPKLKWNLDVMHAKACEGFSFATDLADELAKLGLPFRDAHRVVGQVVSYCVEHSKRLDDLGSDELSHFHPALNQGVLSKITLDLIMERRQSFGGSSTALICEAIRQARSLLADASP